MERFGSGLALWLQRAARHALVLSLIAALTGAQACSRESAPPAPRSPPSPAPAEPAAAAAPEPESPGVPEEVLVASDDVKGLVAPIALYPDPLLELVLQTAVQPAQVVLAARFLEQRARDASLQPSDDWDTAIVGLLNTPDVLTSMNENLDWTSELGQSVANDLDEVQLAVQELRWSAYNTGALRSNEWQEVIVTGDVLAIMPAQREQVAVPQYDGAALLEASTSERSRPAPALPEDSGGLAPAAPAPAGSYGYTAAVPVTYAAPQPSFWSTAAVFAGGAALGGLLGYAIGDDDDDDDDDWNGWGWDDDWDHRPWRGDRWRGGHNDIDIGNVNIIRPARPGVGLRPNRPINRPGGWGGYDRPDRPGRPGLGHRPGRPGLTKPVIGEGGSLGRPGGGGRPALDRPGRPGRPEARPSTRPAGFRPGEAGRPSARPARPRPPGIAPARPTKRPARATREVKLPRPAQVAARPTDRPGVAGGARPARRPTREARSAESAARRPDRGGAFGRMESRPRVARDRARGQQSRQTARQDRPRPQARAAKASRERPAMRKQRGGGGGEHKRQASRGKKSRKR